MGWYHSSYTYHGFPDPAISKPHRLLDVQTLMRRSVFLQGLSTISKVYASSGEPCCAECITPVFDETWSPRSPSWYMPPLPDICESQITDKKSGSFSTSVSLSHLLTLSPKAFLRKLRNSITQIHCVSTTGSVIAHVPLSCGISIYVLTFTSI